MRRARALTTYYLVTPAFAVMDVAFHAPVRVAGLEAPEARWAYYVGLVALGFVCRARPAAAPWVGMGESAVNILLLILAVMVPIWSMPDTVLAGGTPDGPFDRVSMANVILSGGALVVSFHRHQAAALGGRAGAPPHAGV